MSVPVGLTVPKLLPITSTFAPAFAIYNALLSYRAVSARINQQRALGLPDSQNDSLVIASRAHANFTENVPLALLFGAFVELNGGNRRALTTALTVLFVSRIVHVELGLRGKNATQWGRGAGFMGTQAVILGAAGYAAFLVKSYWGY